MYILGRKIGLILSILTLDWSTVDAQKFIDRWTYNQKELLFFYSLVLPLKSLL